MDSLMEWINHEIDLMDIQHAADEAEIYDHDRYFRYEDCDKDGEAC